MNSKKKRNVKYEKQLKHISLEFCDVRIAGTQSKKEKKTSGRTQKFKIEPADVNTHALKS